MSKNNRKHDSKKTRTEAKIYRNNLGELNGGLSGTYTGKTEYLNGSDEIDPEYCSQPTKNDEIIAKKPLHYRITDWISKNGLTVLLGTVLVGTIGWLHGTVVDLKERAAVCEYKIEELEKSISDMEDSIPNMEAVELQIEYILDEIENWNITDAENRITQLEEEVESIVSDVE